jgi:ATP-binding cassette subfamily C protein
MGTAPTIDSHWQVRLFGRYNSNMNLTEQFLSCFQLLSRRNKIKVFLAVVFQSSLGLLDLVGIALTGLIGSIVARTYISTGPSSENMLLPQFAFVDNLRPVSAITLLCIVTTLFFLVKTIAVLIFQKKYLRFLANNQIQISKTLFSNLLMSEMQWISKYDRHLLANIATQGTSAASVNILAQVTSILADCFLLVMFILLISYLNPYIALYCLVYFGLLIFVLQVSVGKRVELYNQNLTKSRISIQETVFSILNLFREIRVSKKQSWFLSKSSKSLEAQASNFAVDVWVQQLPKYVFEIALPLGLFGFMFVTTLSTSASQSLELIALYLVAISRIFPTLLRVQSSIFSLRSFSFLTTSTIELLESLRIAKRNSSSPDLRRTNIEHESNEIPIIQAMEVSFKYERGTHEVLRDINFQISRGERVVITGPSGAGKSTLCDLMLGLLEPTSGEVKIAGISALDWVSQEENVISYLPQQVTLVPGTLRENILLDSQHSKVMDEFLFEVMMKSDLIETLYKLPNGLDTYIDSPESFFSGGQKQRIGIARALVNDPKVIIFDEPTSALDLNTESTILNSMNHLDKDVTVIVIAHSLNTIKRFPRVIYIEGGEISCEGDFNAVSMKIPNLGQDSEAGI